VGIPHGSNLVTFLFILRRVLNVKNKTEYLMCMFLFESDKQRERESGVAEVANLLNVENANFSGLPPDSNKWSKNFLTKDRIAWGRIFLGRQFNVTPSSWEHCSRLWQ